MGSRAAVGRRRVRSVLAGAAFAGAALAGVFVSAVGQASVAGSAPLAGSSTPRPTLTVTSPSRYQSFPAGVLQMNGQAVSAAGITSVQIAITNMANLQVVTNAKARLGPRSGSTTPWSFTWQPSGALAYSVRIQATDKTGATSSPVGREFDVADASGPSFLTLMFGRSQLVVAGKNCQPLPNTVPLDQVAATLKSMNLPGTGSIVTSYIGDSSNNCVNDAQGNDLYPTWTQLDTLRDADGMTFVSQGVNYVDVRTLTTAQQEADICGSLPILAAHGHNRAWGLFGYPNNFFTPTIQSGVTDNCFAFGRSYANVRNHDGLLVNSPWYANGFSLLGGACNSPPLPCYSLQVIGPVTGKLTRYQSPLDLKAMMTVGSGEWSLVQMYTFVTGSFNVGGSGLQWDCSSADWRAHFTTDTEAYCWNDYLTALASLPSGVTVTDPATVAQTFVPDTAVPVASITSGPASPTNQTSATFTFSSSESRSWFQCSLDGAPPQVCDSGVSYSGLVDGPHTFDLTATDPYDNTGTANSSWTVNTSGGPAPASRPRAKGS
jgi:hypothetical protein